MGFAPMIATLQVAALLLGHRALVQDAGLELAASGWKPDMLPLTLILLGTPYEIRTRNFLLEGEAA